MNNKTSFDVWGGLVKSIYDLTKEQIKELNKLCDQFKAEGFAIIND